MPSDDPRMEIGQDELDALCWSLASRRDEAAEKLDNHQRNDLATGAGFEAFHHLRGRHDELGELSALLEMFDVDVKSRAERYDPDEHDHGEIQ